MDSRIIFVLVVALLVIKANSLAHLSVSVLHRNMIGIVFTPRDLVIQLVVVHATSHCQLLNCYSYHAIVQHQTHGF